VKMALLTIWALSSSEWFKSFLGMIFMVMTITQFDHKSTQTVSTTLKTQLGLCLSWVLRLRFRVYKLLDDLFLHKIVYFFSLLLQT
jgi:hypothetical protein